MSALGDAIDLAIIDTLEEDGGEGLQFGELYSPLGEVNEGYTKSRVRSALKRVVEDGLVIRELVDESPRRYVYKIAPASNEAPEPDVEHAPKPEPAAEPESSDPSPAPEPTPAPPKKSGPKKKKTKPATVCYACDTQSKGHHKRCPSCGSGWVNRVLVA